MLERDFLTCVVKNTLDSVSANVLMCIKDKGPIGLKMLVSDLGKLHSDEEITQALLNLSNHSLLKVQDSFGGTVSASEKLSQIDEIYSDAKIRFLAQNVDFGEESGEKEKFLVNKSALFHRLYIPKFVDLADDLFEEDQAGLLIKFLAKRGICTENDLKTKFCQKVEIKTDEDKNGNADDEIKQFLNVLNEENDIKDNNGIKECDKNDNLSFKDDMFKTAFTKLLVNQYIECVKIQSNASKATSDDNTLKTEEYYRINFNRFLLLFRNEKIVTMIGQKTDALCGAIAKLYLDERIEYDLDKLAKTKKLLSGRQLKRKAKVIEDETSGDNDGFVSSLSAVKIKKMLEMRRMGFKDVNKVKIMGRLRELEEIGIKKCFTKENQNGFVIDVENVVSEIKKLEMQALIKLKFGLFASRIFSLLVKEKYLEETHISEMALMQRNDARACLYNLLEWGIVHMKEVPMNNNDPSSNKIFYLWSVPLSLVFREHLSSVLYKSWINLTERQLAEQKTLDCLAKNTAELSEAKNDLLVQQKRVEVLTKMKSRVLDQIISFREF